jgi:RimJ/RimL family protein N-acetyltransferase
MNQDLMFQKEFHSIRNMTLDESKKLLTTIISDNKQNSKTDFCFVKITHTLNEKNYYDSINSVMVGFISVNEATMEEFKYSGFQTLLNFGIIEQFRNIGLMTNALNFRVERFEELGYNIIPAFIKGANPISEKVLKKCGFLKILENNMGSIYVRRITLSKKQFNLDFPPLGVD